MMPQRKLLALVTVVLLGGCDSVEVSLAADRQPLDRVEFVFGGSLSMMTNFSVDEVAGKSRRTVWLVRQGLSREQPRRVRYGVTPPGWTLETASEPLEADRVYCAYAKPWVRACFRVNRDGTATVATP